jgi:hypothetical protein
MEFFGCGIVFTEIGTHETHTAGRITVIELGQDEVFGRDGGAGGIFAARLRMHVCHGSNVV